MFSPSPADLHAQMDPTPSRLYPDLEDMEGDPLGVLGAQKKKKPQRPPPPYSLVASQPRDDVQDLGILTAPPALFPHEIRWFYKEAQKAWQPFNGYDSLTLEECYRRLQGSGEGDLDVSVLGDLYEVNVVDRQCRPIYWTAKEPWMVLRGSWFEVSGDKWSPLQEEESARIEEEHCGRRWRERAKADADLQAWAEAGAPTGNGARQQQEAAGKAQPQPILVLNRLVEEKYEVIWLSENEIYKIKKERMVHMVKKFGEKLGGKGQLYGSLRLIRGYQDPASREDKEPPIGHLIFTVHGIGQNMTQSCITKSTSDFRETCSQVARRHFPDHWREKRVEFLPVEWRTWLSLDKGLLSTITPHGIPMLRSLLNDSIIDVMYYMSDTFGPEIIDGLRFALHKQFAEFTHRHPSFLANGGTVSLMAHSLGSVMAYDLLHDTCSVQGIRHEDSCEDMLGPQSTLLEFTPNSVLGGQGVASGLELGPSRAVELKDMRAVKFTTKLQSPDPDSLYSPTKDEPDAEEGTDYSQAWLELEQLHKRVAELESQLGIATREGGKRIPHGLKFKVEHFFAVGSPLGLFIMMREHASLVKKSHRSTASLIPTSVCRRIHNLHHPSDPIAYRIEPLINSLYAQIKPVKIDSASSKRASQDVVDGVRDLQSPEEKPLVSPQTKSWFSSLVGSIAAVTVGSSKKAISEESGLPKELDKVKDNDNSLRPQDKLKERLDFMLQERFTESSYLNSLTAHTCYWSSQDCALYVLLQIYKYRS